MTETKTSKEDFKVYEIGFHIAPFVGDENVAHEVNAVKNALDSIKAEVISEDFPRLRVLSYPIAKAIKGEKKVFKEAYFGWIKFETLGESVDSFRKEIEKIENIIRFLLISTVRENTLFTAKFVAKDTPKHKKEEKPENPLSEEELDKSIDELVVE